MTLPATIPDVGLYPCQWHCPPVQASSSALYVVLMNDLDASQLQAVKSSDNGHTWAAVGTNPNLTNNIAAVAYFRVGDTLHVATQEETTGRVGYSVFSMASDSWTTSNEAVVTPATAPTYMSVTIMLRSDGDVIVGYEAAPETVMGAPRQRYKYARKEGAAWTVNVALSGIGVSTHFYGGFVVAGGSDRAHFAWSKDAANIQCRTLRGDNTLSAVADVAADIYFPNGGTGYVSAGTTKIRLQVHTVTVKADDADSPAWTNESAGGFVNTAAGVPYKLTALVADLTTLHRLYIANTVTKDVYLISNVAEAGWGSAALELSAQVDNLVSGNVYDHFPNTVLGYIYDDSGVYKYNERVLRMHPRTRENTLLRM